MEKHANLLKWSILILLALTWGSSFILMKRGLRTYDFTELAAQRLIWAGIILLPFFFRSVRKIRKHHWFPLIAVGLFGNGIPAFLFALAQNVIPSSLSGMLNSLTPLFSLLIGVAVFKLKVTWKQATGIILGFGGSILLLSNGMGTSINLQMIAYASLIIVATVCYAISVNLIKFKLEELNAMTITSSAFAFLLIPAIIIFLIQISGRPAEFSWTGTAQLDTIYIGVLGIVGTGLAVVLFSYLIKIANMLFATSVTYLIPIVAISWGFIDNERIQWLDIIGMVIILVGVYLSKRRNEASTS